MSLFNIVQAIGGDLYASGRRASVPAPGHTAQDRSVSLLLENGRVLVHCFGAAVWTEVVDDLRARGLIDRDRRPCGHGAADGGALNARPSSSCARIEAATTIWSLGQPLGRSPAARHLRRRGIRRGLPGAEVIRYVAQAPVMIYRRAPWVRPALAVAIRDRFGSLTAVELTYLTHDGALATDLRLPRKTIGVMPPCCAVRIDPAATTLLVGEGVVTTLSASERFGLPGWALLSTSNLRRWRAPAGVSSVLIAADRGRGGEAAAGDLAAALVAQGVHVETVLPPLPFGDWNEAACGAPDAKEKGERELAVAPGPGWSSPGRGARLS